MRIKRANRCKEQNSIWHVVSSICVSIIINSLMWAFFVVLKLKLRDIN